MRIKVLLIAVIMTLSLIGCSTDRAPGTNEHTDIDETMEDINYAIIVDTNQFLDSEQLKERLLTAVAIELKNTENQTMGMLQEAEKIASLIDNIYTYDVHKELPSNLQGQVVGPINFYFSDNEDIYGLMNNNYIYIEGYYFIINTRIAQELQNTFKANIATAPVGTE